MISVQLSSYSNPAVSAVYDCLWPHGETGTAGYRTTFISCLVSLPAALSLSPCLPFLGSYCLPVFTSSCPQTLCVSSAFFRTAGGVKEGRWEESITLHCAFHLVYDADHLYATALKRKRNKNWVWEITSWILGKFHWLKCHGNLHQFCI